MRQLNFNGDPNFGSTKPREEIEHILDQSYIESYVEHRINESLKDWRVCIARGSRREKPVEIFSDLKINRRERSKGVPIRDTRNKTSNLFKVSDRDAVAVGDDLFIGMSDALKAQLSGIGTKNHQVAALVGMPTIFLHFIRVEVIDSEDNLLADYSYNQDDFSGNYATVSILFNASDLAAQSYTGNKVLFEQMGQNMDQEDDTDEDLNAILEET